MLLVTVAGVLVLVALAGAFVAATVVAHRRAQSAADLAALAAAGARERGGSACEVADEVATENDADLVACRIEGDHVVVLVGVEGPRFGRHGFTPHGLARAGPAD